MQRGYHTRGGVCSIARRQRGDSPFAPGHRRFSGAGG
jgi:hypothetical protein